MTDVQRKVVSIRSTHPFEQWPQAALGFPADKGLRPETVEACEWGYADAATAFAITGHKKAGIVLPQHGPTGEVVGLTLRPIPAKKGYKYLAKPEQGNHFGYPPLFDWPAIISDPTRPIVFTEGSPKAARLAQEGIPAIGINGVYGHLFDGGSLPDFDDVEWNGREVKLEFDSDHDDPKKPGVRDGVIRLADELTRRGAKVGIVLLPTLRGQTKTGVDDFLNHKLGGLKRLLALPAIPPTDPRFDEWRVHPVIAELNKRHAVVQLQGNVRILQEPETEADDYIYFRPADFIRRYENKIVVTGHNDAGKAIRSSYGEFWLRNPGRREYDSVTLKPGDQNTGKHFNLWRGWAIEPKRGVWSLFRKHIDEVICRGDSRLSAWLIGWMAARVQYPAKPAQVAAVLRGEEGIGKSFFAQMFGRLYGWHYMQVSQTRHLVGNFNKHLAGKLLVFADEAYYAGDRSHRGQLYALITEPTINVEFKGVDVLAIPNYLALIMASNEDWVIPASLDARRFAVFEVSPKYKEDRAHFGKIAAQMEAGGYAAMMFDLMRVDLAKVDPWRAPRTIGLTRQKVHALTSAQQFLFEALQTVRLNNQDWPDRGTFNVSKDETALGYYTWLGNTRGDARELRSAQTTFGIAIRKLCPGARNQRPARKGERARVWELPNLHTARKEFEETIQGRIDWQTGEPQ